MLLRSVFVGLALAVCTWAADPVYVGAWKINLEQSKLSNPSMSKGRVMSAVATGPNSITLTEEQPMPNGQVRKMAGPVIFDGKEHSLDSAKVTYDGKERPSEMVPGVTRTDSLVDDHHIHVIFKRDGKQFQVIDVTFSPDGKIMTTVRKGS